MIARDSESATGGAIFPGCVSRAITLAFLFNMKRDGRADIACVEEYKRNKRMRERERDGREEKGEKTWILGPSIGLSVNAFSR